MHVVDETGAQEVTGRWAHVPVQTPSSKNPAAHVLGSRACAQLPAVITPGVTVVVCPLLSLMQDQVGAQGGGAFGWEQPAHEQLSSLKTCDGST